jgi:hypothetical protein
MFVYRYKIQVAVTSMTLYNYINKDSQDDNTFAEFNCYQNFFYIEVLIDVMSRS